MTTTTPQLAPPLQTSAPHRHIDNLINEFLNYDFNRGIDLVTGDFNCRSRLWGYQIEDDRERSMTDFISLNNLHIYNIPELGAILYFNNIRKRQPRLDFDLIQLSGWDQTVGHPGQAFT
ncbi:hypothetical protein AVEN_193111-1 [Araneus ventricosus]|uniref:Endonuclease/exonuclease/phosphatase domain-containing protein n=1 Tax=Araneus ventricosus TaxID=182803 RepID=A0A4Y2B0W5_ARAVE|nr:hypothetical protein AVEN_193111-1 [Araneus ventricosus]